MPQPVGDSRLIEMPGHLIRRLHQISFALFLDQAKAFAVTPVQYAALVAIDRHHGIDQTTLCSIIAFDRTTIGGVVGRLQRMLVNISGSALTLKDDNVFGPLTESVVKEFQRAHGLKDDGVVGPLTWDALAAAAGG